VARHVDAPEVVVQVLAAGDGAGGLDQRDEVAERGGVGLDAVGQRELVAVDGPAEGDAVLFDRVLVDEGRRRRRHQQRQPQHEVRHPGARGSLACRGGGVARGMLGGGGTLHMRRTRVRSTGRPTTAAYRNDAGR
jgi:hypothetical protein